MNLIKSENELTSLSKAAELVGLPISTFWHYAKSYKLIPQPQTKKGNRKYYNPEQLKEVVNAVADLRKKGVLNV